MPRPQHLALRLRTEHNDQRLRHRIPALPPPAGLGEPHLHADPLEQRQHPCELVAGERHQRGARLDRLPRRRHPHARRAGHRHLHGSSIANLKELRPGTVRILFAFDPWRDSILLVAGDKSGRWTQWYREAIPLAEQRYERYLKERRDEEEQQR
jgi:hypothetical protein